MLFLFKNHNFSSLICPNLHSSFFQTLPPYHVFKPPIFFFFLTFPHTLSFFILPSSSSPFRPSPMHLLLFCINFPLNFSKKFYFGNFIFFSLDYYFWYFHLIFIFSLLFCFFFSVIFFSVYLFFLLISSALFELFQKFSRLNWRFNNNFNLTFFSINWILTKLINSPKYFIFYFWLFASSKHLIYEDITSLLCP